MTDLVPTAASYPTRIERQTGRALEQLRSRQAIAAAREVARVAVAETTEALLAASHVSALESLLVSRTSRAEERLRHIADAGAAGPDRGGAEHQSAGAVMFVFGLILGVLLSVIVVGWLAHRASLDARAVRPYAARRGGRVRRPTVEDRRP